MKIGLFWCDEQQSWIDFEINDGIVRGKIARRSRRFPSITDDWETAPSEGFWSVNYQSDDKSPLGSTSYLLKNGRLYFTNWEFNRLRQCLHVSNFNSGYWQFYNINQHGNPFEGYSKPIQDQAIPLYDSLPLLPDAKQKRWRMWQSAAVRGLLVANIQSDFNLSQKNFFCEALTTEIPELSPNSFEHFNQYFDELTSAVTNDKNQLHEKIKTLAAKTWFDEEQGLVIEKTDAERNKVIQTRVKLFFDILQAERKHLMESFAFDEPLPAPLKKPDAINESPQIIEATTKPLVQTNAEDDEDEDEELQLAIQASILATNKMTLKKQETMNEQTPVQLNAHKLKTNPPAKVPLLTLGNIQIAVNCSVKNYQSWYKGGKEFRGPNGFFTWFRHGETGQSRTINFQNEINRHDNTKEDAIAIINTLLTNPKTRNHRHSFASFLLDELVKLKNSPWKGVPLCKKSMRYELPALPEKQSTPGF